MRIGFTGTREGLSGAQQASLLDLLRGHLELHHGCCVGADFDAWATAVHLGIPTEGHPPKNKRLLADTHDNRTRKALPYLVRNRAIVDSTDGLIACPVGYQEGQRSGTWATVRHARRTGKPVTIIWPDGKMSFERIDTTEGES